MNIEAKLKKYYEQDGYSCDVCKFYSKCESFYQPCQSCEGYDWVDELKLNELLELNKKER